MARATVINNTPSQESTIYHNIIFRDGQYVPVCNKAYSDVNMLRRLQWMATTHGGRRVPPGDNSQFAQECMILGLPTDHEATATSAVSVKPDSVDEVARNEWTTRFSWLGDSSNMDYTGSGDVHWCLSCELSLSGFVPGDTFLNQHAYFTRGECPYLKANYTPERLKIEIGQARFLKGFVAHPTAISVPDAWDPPKVELTRRIYVTLAERQWCYMCGRLPGATDRLLPENEGADNQASGCDLSLLNRLGDPSNMTYAEQTDSYWCSRCNLNIFVFDPDDTFLTQHAYLTRGECPHLKAHYTPERIEMEIGQSRFLKGSLRIRAIAVPDAWNPRMVELTSRIS
ncbi:hypothetical protein DPEC_G00067720 [Dallia pectoralis]|uniref:Uncharacterized protein n=1 Tax=Dallia pectoralis TaxID=75939 RepID=A0ACC2H253_DALPE|nr:hypothetical protein DPEC_G00067720 [Dallia pectoralis]